VIPGVYNESRSSKNIALYGGRTVTGELVHVLSAHVLEDKAGRRIKWRIKLKA
jgi:hypothetical protein